MVSRERVDLSLIWLNCKKRSGLMVSRERVDLRTILG